MRRSSPKRRFRSNRQKKKKRTRSNVTAAAGRAMLTTVSTLEERSENYWFDRHSKSIIFLIIILGIIGIYEAFQLPVAVFPTTNFPLIKIGVDNGVMPIAHMQVTITRPIEQAVNIVLGLQSVRSLMSRGSADIDLFFDWN